MCITACKGASLLMIPNPYYPEPEQILEDMDRLECTPPWMTSSGLYNIACAAKRNAPELSPHKLAAVLTSGEMAHKSKFAIIGEALRPQTFLSLWGMTEGAPILGYSQQDLVQNPKKPPVATAGRIVSVGRQAMPGAMVKIAGLDDIDGHPLPRSEYGALHVFSEALILGYLDGRGSDGFYLDVSRNRWFRTEDLAMMDTEGHVYNLGRIKELSE